MRNENTKTVYIIFSSSFKEGLNTQWSFFCDFTWIPFLETSCSSIPGASKHRKHRFSSSPEEGAKFLPHWRSGLTLLHPVCLSLSVCQSTSTLKPTASFLTHTKFIEKLLFLNISFIYEVIAFKPFHHLSRRKNKNMKLAKNIKW